MKLVFLAYFGEGENGNQFGGAEKVFANLANWIAENTEHKVIFSSVGFEALPYPLSKRIEYKHYSANLSSRLKTQFSLIKNVFATVRDFKPDAIISFSIHPLFYLTICPFAHNIPFFFSVRNDPKLENGIATRFLRYFVMKKARGIVFQTKDAQQYFNQAIINKSVIIHNPVSIKADDYPFIGFDNRIVFVGRLNRQKNIPLLINAFNKIKDNYSEINLEIYGEGFLRSEIQNLIDSLDLNDRVYLMGAHSDVLKKISGARMFVLPSLYEGMPNALMEAMALGIPSVASDCPCGGPRELINDGQNGFLFENNDLESLKEKMQICLNTKDPKVISIKAREICETHSFDIIYKKWKDFIEGMGSW